MQKECLYVIMLKMALLLFKIYGLVGKKGISGLVSKVAAKPSAIIRETQVQSLSIWISLESLSNTLEMFMQSCLL